MSRSLAIPTNDLYWKLVCMFLLCVFILLLHMYTLCILQRRLRIVGVCVCVCVCLIDVNDISTIVSFSNLIFLCHYYVFEIYTC